MSHDLKQHIKTYKRVWISLFVLTYITVHVAYFDFGVLNIAIAMFVATVKASLVILFFMHMKEDNRLNQVVFGASFLFVAIFVFLILADTMFRPNLSQAKVVAVQAPAGSAAALHAKYRDATPELLAHGKTVYLSQCQACHGASGKGDGPAAAALKPVPRDFTSGKWTQGGKPSAVFKIVSAGISGTSMSSFATLSVKDRWAAVHYIRSLSPNAPAETNASWKQSGLAKTASSSSSLPKLPTEMAMDILVEEAGQTK